MSDRDTTALQSYLGEHFAPGTVSELKLGATGASNDTLFFTVTASDGPEQRYVLRAQTGGHQLFLGVEVLFQAQVMRGVAAASDIPVPAVVLEEPDDTIVGSPFYVMRCVPGWDIPVVPSWQSEGRVVELPVADRARLWSNAVQMIARIGGIDWRAGLGFLDVAGRGEPGLDRYLHWVEDWAEWALKGRPHPIVEAGLRHAREHQPPDPPVEFVWGDATLMNMLYDDDLSVTSVLDWEMAAIGPAELDLGWFLFMGDMYSTGFGLPRLEGLPGRDETIALYAEHLGRPMADDMRYYEVLGALRMSIVTQRFIDLQVEYGKLPPDTALGTNNPATVVLAEYLGLERISSADDLDVANRAAANAERGR